MARGVALLLIGTLLVVLALLLTGDGDDPSTTAEPGPTSVGPGTHHGTGRGHDRPTGADDPVAQTVAPPTTTPPPSTVPATEAAWGRRPSPTSTPSRAGTSRGRGP